MFRDKQKSEDLLGILGYEKESFSNNKIKSFETKNNIQFTAHK